jgi:general secretion pathway protein G
MAREFSRGAHPLTRHCPVLFLFLATILAQGCAVTNYEEQAKDAVGNTLANRRDAQYQKMQKFPGKVVCGEVAQTDRWGPTDEFRPFIVRGDDVIIRPSSQDLEIYCSNNPRKSLENMLQSGPIKDNQALQQITSDMLYLQQALEKYLEDAKTLPSTKQGLQALITPIEGVQRPIHFREGGYLQSIPNDPWGRPYVYTRSALGPAVAPRYKLYTLGADGKKGGSGADADISKRELDYLLHVSKL